MHGNDILRDNRIKEPQNGKNMQFIFCFSGATIEALLFCVLIDLILSDQ